METQSGRIRESDIDLKKLTNSAKTVRELYQFLHHQPHAHYRGWGYGEPSEKSVRKLLGSNPVFAILLNGELVGIIGFTYRSSYFVQLYSGQFWLHYIVDKDHNKMGIATAATSKLLKIMKEEANISRVYAEISSTNLASIRVVEKLGFVKRRERTGIQIFEKVI